MRSEVVDYGNMWFDSKIDIADPCYKKGADVGLYDVKIKPGVYLCRVEKVFLDDGEKAVSSIFIRHTDSLTEKNLKYEHLDIIGVDSGLAGFFNDKKDYDREEWLDFCKRVYDPPTPVEKKAYIIDDGFFSQTGLGDGDYDVGVWRGRDGDIVRLCITFIRFDRGFL